MTQREAPLAVLACDDASRVWIPDLVERIALHLPPNELPCTLRLVDKATAALFSGPHHTTVRLSQPVPHHFFAHIWSQPGAMRALTLSQRHQLLSLTIITGVTPNLELLLSCNLPVTSALMEAAASAGQLATCLRLHQAGCPWGDALQEAAGAGHLAVCEGLLAAGCPWSWGVISSAICGGHLALTGAMAKYFPHRPGFMVRSEELLAVAHGCDLVALQSFHERWKEIPVPRINGRALSFLNRHYSYLLLPTAAGSPTPDWQAKVEWLEGLGYPKTAFACHAAAGCTDAAARRGVAAGPGTLHAAGCPVSPLDVACAAAEGGHLAAVAWAVEAFGAAATLHVRVFSRAARSGRPEVLAWLRERECPWDEQAFTNAAEAGSAEALEWLAERGCPMPDDGYPYFRAARNGDLQTLACLRRLGCPWGPVGDVFGRSLKGGCPLLVLRALVEAGCPVDWRAAAKAARVRWGRKGDGGAAVRHWIATQRKRMGHKAFGGVEGAAAGGASAGAPSVSPRRRLRWWQALVPCAVASSRVRCDDA
ncbi:hypothetical protein GPECTOR_31g295 [Gonium pectorale]|uniref:Ankyrin repeat domain-containing protein n=1 Tax=Gonium pectorale TaxID=33097 RepID=A0A150GDS6_GONPE|nr:hypothetical protein GPECTOR_31g295 [Gonium pectorale]|eukprot:KXZ47933.1 hypothetical protein GPECTOR_31g295 [Gonium pectorale]